MNVVFTKYVKLVLPIDGYVFWVRADLLSQSALVGATLMNAAPIGSAPSVVTPAATVTVDGSLHYATDVEQSADKTVSRNRLLFTCQALIEDFNQIGPAVLFIAIYEGVQFAFSGRDWWFTQTGTYHYVGTAVYSDMATQLISSMNGFDPVSSIVSNSLPLWLALNNYVPIYPTFGNSPGITLYPSFLSPLNLKPPYATIAIPPESTEALQATPAFDGRGSHWQLVSERVLVTLWGTRNATAMDFIDMVNQHSLDYDTFGIMSTPVPRDEKRSQTELQALAMKKTIEYRISYYQQRANDVARQLILSAIPTLLIGQQQVRADAVAT